MVLTDRQREDLHAGIYEYLLSRGEPFAPVAEAFAAADPAANKKTNNVGKTPLLEKKWTAIPRLQKKVLELERIVAQNAKIHAHRTGTAENGSSVQRRMLPRLPCAHTLQGHSAGVTCVRVHPVFTVVVSGSEDGTIKVNTVVAHNPPSGQSTKAHFPRLAHKIDFTITISYRLISSHLLL